MDIDKPLPLLAHLTPAQFMRRHWQKKPLLIRQAIPGFAALLSRQALFELAASPDVESRLVQRQSGGGWRMARGPLGQRALPPLKRSGWSLLVQGVDLHHDGVRSLLDAFRFVPEARLDDVMISYATPDGGVGPHFDSYDVFLLQAHGKRRWRIGRQSDLSLVEGAPLKILRTFVPELTFDLEPGDMLYLPPLWAHDGVALDECMTYSIGFRAPARTELQRELLQRLADQVDADTTPRLYQDKKQTAVARPAEIPPEMLLFSEQSVAAAIGKSADSEKLHGNVTLALGEYLTEPKAAVWFDAPTRRRSGLPARGTLRLDRRSRMLYLGRNLFVNGESFAVGGRDGVGLRELADARMMPVAKARQLSAAAQEALVDWLNAGWLHVRGESRLW